MYIKTISAKKIYPFNSISRTSNIPTDMVKKNSPIKGDTATTNKELNEENSDFDTINPYKIMVNITTTCSITQSYKLHNNFYYFP